MHQICFGMHQIEENFNLEPNHTNPNYFLLKMGFGVVWGLGGGIAFLKIVVFLLKKSTYLLKKKRDVLHEKNNVLPAEIL